MQIARMNDFAQPAGPTWTPTSANERLKWARMAYTELTVSQAADALGVPYGTYSQHENGSQGRGLSKEAAEKYAKFYRIDFQWLLTGRGVPRGKPVVAILGYIGAGAEIIPVDDSLEGAGLEYVDLPPGMEWPCAAAKVRGNSMFPLLEEGWVVFWVKHQDGVPDECIGSNCAVKLPDGRMFVKRLRRGRKSGRYTLESWNAPTMEDVIVEWAAKIRYISCG